MIYCGSLMVTEKTLEAVAASLGMVSMNIEGNEMFLPPDLDSASILREVSLGDIPCGTYVVFMADYAEDVNLSAAVCW